MDIKKYLLLFLIIDQSICAMNPEENKNASANKDSWTKTGADILVGSAAGVGLFVAGLYVGPAAVAVGSVATAKVTAGAIAAKAAVVAAGVKTVAATKAASAATVAGIKIAAPYIAQASKGVTVTKAVIWIGKLFYTTEKQEIENLKKEDLENPLEKRLTKSCEKNEC